MSTMFGCIFTIVGSLVTTGTVDWQAFPMQAVVGILIGCVVGLILPAAKIAAFITGRLAKPNTLFYKMLFNAILMASILVFICPLITLLNGKVFSNVPMSQLLPNMYAFFIPFLIAGFIALMLFGDLIMKLSLKCAGVNTETLPKES